MQNGNRPPVVLLPGLTFDKRHFEPLVRELAILEPSRRVLSLDLPGHRDSLPPSSYAISDIAAAVNRDVRATGIDEAVVLVGHSAAGIIATEYAARFPAAAVLNLDQPLLPGPFGTFVREAEPVLRGPHWRGVWNQLLGGMAIDELPPEMRGIVNDYTNPRQDLLLGYWSDVLNLSDDEIEGRRAANLRAIAERGIAYHWVSSFLPPAPYREWLTSLVPNVAITVLPGSHFPHLEQPAEMARMLAG